MPRTIVIEDPGSSGGFFERFVTPLRDPLANLLDGRGPDCSPRARNDFSRNLGRLQVSFELLYFKPAQNMIFDEKSPKATIVMTDPDGRRQEINNQDFSTFNIDWSKSPATWWSQCVWEMQVKFKDNMFFGRGNVVMEQEERLRITSFGEDNRIIRIQPRNIPGFQRLYSIVINCYGGTYAAMPPDAVLRVNIAWFLPPPERGFFQRVKDLGSRVGRYMSRLRYP